MSFPKLPELKVGRLVVAKHAALPPNKSMNRTFYSGPPCGGFAIFTSGRATVQRRLSKR